MRGIDRVLGAWIALVLAAGGSVAALDGTPAELAVDSDAGGRGDGAPTLVTAAATTSTTMTAATSTSTTGATVVVDHELPRSVPSAAVVVPPPDPVTPTTAAPAEPTSPFVPSPSPPFVQPPTPAPPPSTPVGEIPPPYSEAPYVRVASGTFNSQLRTTAPADGGRPGEVITVTVDAVFAGSSAGRIVVRGPMDYSRPYEEQPERIIDQWSDPCQMPWQATVSRTATFEVLLGPGDHQYNYEVQAYIDVRCDGVGGHPPTAGFLQLTFWSWVARPVAPSSPPHVGAG